MKNFFHSRDGASKGAALMIVLAFVVLLTGLALAYFSRASTDRQLAHSSYNDTSADLLACTALDIVVGDFKQEIISNPTIDRTHIQPVAYPSPIPTDIPNLIRYSFRNASASRASNISSADVSGNGRSISTSRWNSHYLIPRGSPSDPSINSSPVQSFTSPDWVLVTAQGPTPSPSPNAVVGRYAFTVYDEGGLLDMNLAGSPIWHADDPNYGWGNLAGCAAPAPTPWLVNIGRKGTVAFADLTALGQYAPPQSQVDRIVGWRNFLTTVRSYTGFPNTDPSYGSETTCTGSGRTGQDSYGSYLLYFGDPPFTIGSLSDKLLASLYPFTAVPNYTNTKLRTDQSLTTRQALLKLRSSLGFSQNVLQYMGTFSRERNWPAPDWPHLNGHLSDGRFNMNNLALVVPNPDECNTAHGKKRGWQTGKNRNHICGTPGEIVDLFGLFWLRADSIPNNSELKIPGHWWYIDHTGPNPNGSPEPNYNSIICWDPTANRNQGRQADFFQILHYALNVSLNHADHCGGGSLNKERTFAIGASLIDQYDSGTDCVSYPPTSWPGTGCDLDSHVVNGTNNGNPKYSTHTTAIEYGQGNGNRTIAFGMEPDIGDDSVNGDCPAGQQGQWRGQNCNQAPHRPCVVAGNSQFPCAPNESPGPTPTATTQVISHAFSSVGEFGYGIDTFAAGLPTLNFNPPAFRDAPVLDFFCYNPISSAYPRAGIVNLYTRNAPVLAAILASTLKTDAAASVNPAPSPVIAPSPAATSEAMNAAKAIVCETQWVLTGTNPPGCSAASGWSVSQTDMTRGIAARLGARAARDVPSLATSDETTKSVARALAEVGQTRTWNLFIDVIAQTGKYKPNSQNLSGSNFVVEGEKRYWLHISLGRDLVCPDGRPYLADDPGSCSLSQATVDVLGSQLEEVIE
jgi:hypothetical protein